MQAQRAYQSSIIMFHPDERDREHKLICASEYKGEEGDDFGDGFDVPF